MSLHANAVATLERWTAPDAAQEALRAEFIDHLHRHADGVWRECAPAHLTGTSLVIDPVARRVLLVLHAKVELWLPAGGHCEPGDATLADTALREAREETGVAELRLLDPTTPTALDKHRAPCRPGVVDHHLDVHYFSVAPTGAVPTISAESHDVAWFDYDDLPEPVGDDVRPLVARAALITPAVLGSRRRG